MQLMKILKDDHELLRVKCVEVPIGADRKELVSNMLATMKNANGIGLAAPQVGVVERIIVTRINGTERVLINPQLQQIATHKEWQFEECLSLPGKRLSVRRPARCVVTAYDAGWMPVSVSATGLLCRVILHELDHLNGVLMTDEEAGVIHRRPRNAPQARRSV